jgi:hypothetical protein
VAADRLRSNIQRLGAHVDVEQHVDGAQVAAGAQHVSGAQVAGAQLWPAKTGAAAYNRRNNPTKATPPIINSRLWFMVGSTSGKSKPLMRNTFRSNKPSPGDPTQTRSCRPSPLAAARKRRPATTPLRAAIRGASDRQTTTL